MKKEIESLDKMQLKEKNYYEDEMISIVESWNIPNNSYAINSSYWGISPILNAVIPLT